MTLPKNFRLTAALSIVGLALIGGCSSTESPQATSRSNLTQSDAIESSSTTTETVTKVEAPVSNFAVSLVSPDTPDPVVNAAILQYVKTLAAKGFAKETQQGVWMQSGNSLLANYRGTIPLPAASVTKVATTLAALQTLGPDYQYVTLINATGPIKDGVLQGDLVVRGDGDPLFVWEEAISLGNTLNQIGINKVTGNLIIVGKFYMNFKTDPHIAGTLLKQGINNKIWSETTKKQYFSMSPGTPKPLVEIQGSVKVMPSTPSNLKPLVRHYSFPLAELLKRMNRYSNNHMAEMIASSVGGAKVVAQKAADAAGVPQAEVQLVNGSGLSPENRISPRAACAMFLEIERYLASHNMTIGDVFAIVGRDEGTLDKRNLPPLIVVKSGTLNSVSSLAGVFPTQKQGSVWFAIMNVGENTDEFRIQQETLLKSFLQEWGEVSSLPAEFTPNPELQSRTSRSEIVR
ncbi:D-alanyl-D-alanine carboxypeptidase [Aerosakkonema sp. BLCC-F183]|uniref:D-alanyl-D-alanine carboxypeptidase n=1 Tax=Aerosakkonema sp. BLCC-F183 TaxID=3342834 RepID=UPI0035B8D52C